MSGFPAGEDGDLQAGSRSSQASDQQVHKTSERSAGARADAELSIHSADSHRGCGNGSLEHGGVSGIALLPTEAVGQHQRRDEDRSLRQDREVQRIAGPGIHRPHTLRAFDFDGGRISALHYPVQPDFAYPATKAAHQRRGELVGHGTTPLQALEAGVEGEGLGMADTWAGLTPRHRESDVKVSRGHITKQGSRILRRALIEAIKHVPAGHPLRQRRDDIIARRGAQATNIAKVAMARQLLTWVYYAMRDGQARSLAAALRQAG